ncbi:MAG: 3-hydroxybutyrate dehydrogenase [Deferribacteres bacterium]|jgi:3-hydroxybutyrate dehydrogenase|nr:3-hydroxybutyrate dehydrogenase [Deferribacteraceae bacterium]MDK2793278.1 3-hydroxybutyrate dehydrogenase [Deferribacteres bacterium]
MKKVAIVTGGASGIGLSVAKALSKNNYNVVISDINEETGAKVASDLGGFFVKTDLSKANDCKMLIEASVAHYGTVDILVNNAGIQHVCPIADFPEEKWNFIISLMLTAPFLLTKYVWPYMKEKGWGRIINISSVHGLRASEFKSAYVSAKHGLMGLTKVAALEGANCGITVNAISPGYVRTPLVDNQIDDQAKTHGISREEVLEKVILKKQAIKRMIEPDELGEAVLYLCSDAARCMTGNSLTIDCGWTAQ